MREKTRLCRVAWNKLLGDAFINLLISGGKKVNELSDTQQYKDLVALTNGGGFGLFKCGDFEQYFAFKNNTAEMTEEEIKLMFADLGRQMAVRWKHRK
jgi:hypothetical protein